MEKVDENYGKRMMCTLIFLYLIIVIPMLSANGDLFNKEHLDNWKKDLSESEKITLDDNSEKVGSSVLEEYAKLKYSVESDKYVKLIIRLKNR